MVFASACAFICATINRSPLAASVTTAVISPSASNLGVKARLSSMSGELLIASARPLWALLRMTAKGLPIAAPQHGHEADLLVDVVAEGTSEIRGHGQRAGLCHAAQRHAHMLGLDHHRNAARLEDLVDRDGDLRGQMLLRLQPLRV